MSRTGERLRIVVTGLIAQHPTLGGVAWDYAQYAAGFKRLGHDVFYLEDSGQWPYDETGAAAGRGWVAEDPNRNLAHLAAVMARFGMEDRWAYRFPTRPSWFGMSGRRRREVIASADLLVNVSGTLRRPEEHRPAGRLVYIDSDPGFTQVKLKLPRGQRKFRKRVDAHDLHFTFGESLPDRYRDTGHTWRPTRQPVLLDKWFTDTPPGRSYTTVMSWTSYPPLRHQGMSYGQKDIELRRFAALPSRIRSVDLELALGGTGHAKWESSAFGEDRSGTDVRSFLGAAGWRLTDPKGCCAGLDDYRRYVVASRGEWSVAKNGYVVAKTGWFSCRSACYLAASRPVVVQDTGFANVIPVGDGVFPFSTYEEAVDALETVERDHTRHARAAREIAREYFDSDRVLRQLVDDSSW